MKYFKAVYYLHFWYLLQGCQSCRANGSILVVRWKVVTQLILLYMSWFPNGFYGNLAILFDLKYTGRWSLIACFSITSRKIVIFKSGIQFFDATFSTISICTGIVVYFLAIGLVERWLQYELACLNFGRLSQSA